MDAEKYKLENGLNIEADQDTAANRALYRRKTKNTLEVGTDDLVSDGEEDDDHDSDYLGTDSDYSDERGGGRRGGKKAYSPPAPRDESDSDGDVETLRRPSRARRKPPGRSMGRAKSKFDVGGGGGGRRSRKKYKPNRRKSRRKLPKVDSASPHEDDEESDYDEY